MDIPSIWRRLLGETEPTMHSAPPMASYPSRRDAEDAQDYGFGYGTPLEPYIQGKRARVVGQLGKNEFLPSTVRGMSPEAAASTARDESQSRNLDLDNPAYAPQARNMGTTLTQAALATNRIPLAALGFDPNTIAFDTMLGGSNVAGAYSPNKDSIFSTLNDRDPSTPVHESIHRGIEHLRKDPSLESVFKGLPSEEMLVRHLMATQAGDPEKEGGKASKAQRDSAKFIFDNSIHKNTYKQNIEKLNQAAILSILARQPKMGPR